MRLQRLQVPEKYIPFVNMALVRAQDTSPHQLEALFQQKLKLCSVVFDMTDPMENARWDDFHFFGPRMSTFPNYGLTVYCVGGASSR